MVKLAGDGPISDGVPKTIGRGGKSALSMPSPPRMSRGYGDGDTQPSTPTRRVRRPYLNTGKLLP